MLCAWVSTTIMFKVAHVFWTMWIWPHKPNMYIGRSLAHLPFTHSHLHRSFTVKLFRDVLFRCQNWEWDILPRTITCLTYWEGTVIVTLQPPPSPHLWIGVYLFVCECGFVSLETEGLRANELSTKNRFLFPTHTRSRSDWFCVSRARTWSNFQHPSWENDKRGEVLNFIYIKYKQAWGEKVKSAWCKGSAQWDTHALISLLRLAIMRMVKMEPAI